MDQPKTLSADDFACGLAVKLAIDESACRPRTKSAGRWTDSMHSYSS